MTYKILRLNKIAEKGLNTFNPKKYKLSETEKNPNAILVRSASLHDLTIPATLEVVGRAGVGVNNIPVNALTNLGIPVLNAPGANANAVKELVLTGMLLASRHICRAWDYARSLEGDNQHLNQEVEKNKKQFRGMELPGRTLGIIGLGNIGVKVANAACSLGMKVIGFDQHITVENAWKLSATVEKAQSLAEVAAKADFLTVHVPLLEQTKGMINAKLFKLMKPGVVILNFARDGIVNNTDLKEALEKGKVSSYVSDFPNELFQNNPHVITLPHLGASTIEAEENCAVMVAENIQEYLEHGTIRNSVNFPNVVMPRTEGFRLSIANKNVPNIIAQITTTLSNQGINILDMINKSREEIAYNLLDTDSEISDDTLAEIRKIGGVVRARKL